MINVKNLNIYHSGSCPFNSTLTISSNIQEAVETKRDTRPDAHGVGKTILLGLDPDVVFSMKKSTADWSSIGYQCQACTTFPDLFPANAHFNGAWISITQDIFHGQSILGTEERVISLSWIVEPSSHSDHRKFLISPTSELDRSKIGIHHSMIITPQIHSL